MQSFEDIRKKLKLLDDLPHGKKGFILMGNTRVGKSTLYLLLQNVTLKIKKKDQRLQMRLIEPEQQKYKSMISSRIKSHTELPNIYLFDEKQEIYLIDMPGTKDSDYKRRILNSIYIRQAILKMQSVHFLVLTEINNENSFSQLQVIMFEEIMKILPLSQRHITICVNKIKTQKKDSTKKQLKKIIQTTFQKRQNNLPQFFTQALTQNAEIFFLRYPTENMINQNFLIDQNIKNFIYDANYQPIKECAVRPADISDGLNKGNSCQQTLSTIERFIFEEINTIINIANQIKDILTKFINEFENSQKMQKKQEKWLNKNHQMLNLINFIYVKTENEASKDHNEEKLKDLKQFYDDILDIMKQFNDFEEKEEIQGLIKVISKKIYQIYCFTYFFNGNKNTIGKTIDSYEQRFSSQFLKIQQQFQKIQSSLTIFPQKQIQIFLSFHLFIVGIDKSSLLVNTINKNQITEKEIYIDKIKKGIQLLLQVFGKIFSYNKNKELYQTYLSQEFQKKLEDKVQEIQKSLQFYLNMKNKKLEDVYKQSIIDESEQYPLKMQKVMALSLLEKWKKNNSPIKDLEEGLSYCQTLGYEVTKQQILKQIPRKRCLKNYNLFLKWGDKYVKGEEFEKAKWLYNCAWQCIQDFNQQQENEIIEKKKFIKQLSNSRILQN